MIPFVIKNGHLVTQSGVNVTDTDGHFVTQSGVTVTDTDCVSSQPIPNQSLKLHNKKKRGIQCNDAAVVAAAAAVAVVRPSLLVPPQPLISTGREI